MAIQRDFWPSYAYWKLDKTDFGEHREKGSTGIKNHPEGRGCFLSGKPNVYNTYKRFKDQRLSLKASANIDFFIP